MSQDIKRKIDELLSGDYGFDVYVVMKEADQPLKNMVLYEGRPGENNGFKIKIRNSIANSIRERFLSEGRKYEEITELATEQNCIFIIKQNTAYQPFSYLNIPDEQIQNFSLADKEKADALFFKFIKQDAGQVKTMWAYQKIQPSAIPNKRKQHFQIKVKNSEIPDVFEEMTDQLFMITHTIDLLVIDNKIVTDNIKLMERHFGLETFVRASAGQAVNTITAVQLIENEEKLSEYIQRPNKKYARKMLQIHKYPVMTMTREHLLEKVQTVARWQNVFELKNGQIHLRNYSDVERVIDLFTERYTKSEISGQEYDTIVKEVAEI